MLWRLTGKTFKTSILPDYWESDEIPAAEFHLSAKLTELVENREAYTSPGCFAGSRQPLVGD